MTKKKETCKWYVSIEEPECGKVATSSVKTKITRRDSAKVPLCTEHKHKYDEQYARMRVEPKASA
jgi:hypothetical protein